MANSKDEILESANLRDSLGINVGLDPFELTLKISPDNHKNKETSNSNNRKLPEDDFSINFQSPGLYSEKMSFSSPNSFTDNLLRNKASSFTALLDDCYVSENKLKMITGCSDLQNVTFLELKVNTSETVFSHVGNLLPNLLMLKLSGSFISSVRDLGTSLNKLKVLWLSRSCLDNLDGLSSFTTLEEFYVSHNNIMDLSSLSVLEQLKLLDLEGNLVSDLHQLHYLTLCPNLISLSLEGNPICYESSLGDQLNYNYKEEVRKMLPSLKYLDDEILKEGVTSIPLQDDIRQEYECVTNAIKNVFKEYTDEAESFTSSQKRRPMSSIQISHPLFFWADSLKIDGKSNSANNLEELGYLTCSPEQAMEEISDWSKYQSLLKYEPERLEPIASMQKVTKEEVFSELKEWKTRHDCDVKARMQKTSLKRPQKSALTSDFQNGSQPSTSSICPRIPVIGRSRSKIKSQNISAPSTPNALESCSPAPVTRPLSHNMCNKLPNLRVVGKSPLHLNLNPDSILESATKVSSPSSEIVGNRFKVLPKIERATPSPSSSFGSDVFPEQDVEKTDEILLSPGSLAPIHKNKTESTKSILPPKPNPDPLNPRYSGRTKTAKPPVPHKRPITSKAVLQHIS